MGGCGVGLSVEEITPTRNAEVVFHVKRRSQHMKGHEVYRACSPSHRSVTVKCHYLPLYGEVHVVHLGQTNEVG